LKLDLNGDADHTSCWRSGLECLRWHLSLYLSKEGGGVKAWYAAGCRRLRRARAGASWFIYQMQKRDYTGVATTHFVHPTPIGLRSGIHNGHALPSQCPNGAACRSTD
jgi:hypothetical protein